MSIKMLVLSRSLTNHSIRSDHVFDFGNPLKHQLRIIIVFHYVFFASDKIVLILHIHRLLKHS